ENAAYTHRDRFARNILFAEEITRRINTRNLIKGYKPGQRLLTRTRFVETNVARPTDTKNLNIDSSQPVNFFFVRAAVFKYLLLRFKRTIGYMDILPRNVDVRK